MRNRHQYSHKELLREKQQLDEFEELLVHVKGEIQRRKLHGKKKRAYIERISMVYAKKILPVCPVHRFVSIVLNK